MKDEAADTDIDADANGLFILDDSNNKHPISIRTIASFYAHQPIMDKSYSPFLGWGGTPRDFFYL